MMGLGLLSPSFLLLRPNRIESGLPISIYSLVKNPGFLLLTLVLILGIGMTVILLKKTPKLNLFAAILLFWLFLFLVGETSRDLLLEQPAESRVSLGVGFWLFFCGILLFLRQGTDAVQRLHSAHPLHPWIPAMVFSITLAGISLFFAAGWLDSISLMAELSQQKTRIWGEFLRHMQLTLHAVITGFFLSFLLGYGAYRKTWIERPVNWVANFFQVLPTLSFLGLLMVPLSMLVAAYPFLKSLGIRGIGYFPAFLVLTSYTLLPLTNHILAGFRSVSSDLLEGARGMGMSSSQILYQIELPLALPAIYTGIRTALVQTVSNTILAGLVGGGGLGALLFLGLAQSAMDLVVVSSLLIVLVSVTLNLIMTGLEASAKRWQQKEALHD